MYIYMYVPVGFVLVLSIAGLFSKLKSLTVAGNAFDFGKIPLFVAQRTNTSGFQPTLDTIEMKDVTAVSKGNG